MKKILLILGLVLLNLSLVLAGPDPIVSLYASDINPEDATLVAVAYDSYDNRGIEWIGIYESGVGLIKEKSYDSNCEGRTICGESLRFDVKHPIVEPGESVKYYAKARDLDKNENEIPLGFPESDSAVVIVNYQGVPNQNPVLDVIGNKQIDEDEDLSFKIEATDADNLPSELSYSADLAQLPAGNNANFDINTQTFTWTPVYDDSGVYNVIFSVQDVRGGSDSEEVTITVNDVNLNLPVWSRNIADVTVDEDFASFTHITDLSTYVTDTDNDIITFSAVDDDNVDCGINGNQLVINSVPDWNGAASCTVSADDGRGGIVDDSFSITVRAVNDDPVVEPIDDIIIIENQEVKISVVANDVDGDTLIYSIINDPGFVQNGNEFIWQTTYDDSGVYDIEASVNDGSVTITEPLIITVYEDSDKDGAPDYLLIEFIEPDDEDEYFVGETIEGEIRVRNNDVSDMDVDIEIVLYDDTDDDEIDEVDFDDKEIETGEDKEFDFDFELDYNLDEGNDYIIYAEVYTGGFTFRKEIDLDIDRKKNDVIVEDMRVNVARNKLEVVLDVVNRGSRDQDDVYIDMTVVGLGLSKSGESFSLEDWDGSNRAFKKFIFELDGIESGVYSIEAALNYGSSFDYITKDFKISEIDGVSVIESSFYEISEEEPEFELFTIENITFGLVDFLLLVVVIYIFMWLIKRV